MKTVFVQMIFYLINDIAKICLFTHQTTKVFVEQRSEFSVTSTVSKMADKLVSRTDMCVAMACLLVLQLDLVQSGNGERVVNLTPDEVQAFVKTHPKFMEVSSKLFYS